MKIKSKETINLEGVMDWLTHIVTFLIGLGAGWTLKVGISNRSSEKSQTQIVSQKGNHVGGDMAAGDMHKNNQR
jgi:hypothetical protein